MDHSVGGCPLECPFDPNENFAESIMPVGPPPVFQGLDFALDQYEAMDLPTCRYGIAVIDFRYSVYE